MQLAAAKQTHIYFVMAGINLSRQPTTPEERVGPQMQEVLATIPEKGKRDEVVRVLD
jgi:hypothetical protein